jgi:type IV pilus biogenesis/stability protein PilW
MGSKTKKDRLPDDRSRDRREPAGQDGAPEAERRARERFVALAVCGLLLLAVVLVFGQTVEFGFVNYDDNDYVYDNPHLAHGLSAGGIVWALTTNYVYNWHPLTWLSYLADYQLSGLAPWECHLMNVLLHAAAVIVLFLVLRRMTGDLWPSAFVAAVFAIHPLRVESVAWIAERKDVLSGLFFMLTLAAYVGYVRRPFSLARYLAVLALFALGLMAKPMLVTLPFVLLLLDYWPLGRKSLGWWRLVVEKLPLLALSVVSCRVTFVAQTLAIKPLDFIPFSSRIGNALVSYAVYVRQFFYPVGLAVFYPHAVSRLPSWQIAGALLLLAGVSVGAVAWRRKCPYLLVGWCWYLGMLVPAIGLVQVGSQSMADRYTYLPQIGLAIALAWGAKCSLGSWPYRTWLWGILAALAVTVLIGCARWQTSYWRDSETLWTRDLECAPPSEIAYVNLGAALEKQGRLDEAIARYRAALGINPRYTEAYTNLGIALTAEGKEDEAIVEYQKALDISPDYAHARYNLGLAYYNQGRWDDAIAQFRWALRLNPDHADSHNNLGNALTRQGKLDQAIEEYRRAVDVKPNYARAHYNLGVVLCQQGHLPEAIAEYRKALTIEPDEPDTYVNLGIALVREGRLDEAILQFQQAIKIKPEYVEARHNLATALYQRGRMADAIAQWNEILRVQPENVVALTQLAHVLATSPEASVRDGARAVELAGRAEKLTADQQPAVLDVLAAAYAEAGRFAEAVQTARQALDLATQQNNPSLAESIKAKIPLYEARNPFRAMPQPAPAGSTRP